MNFDLITLGDLLDDKGYIRGPFGSALKRSELKEEGIPVYEQQHAIRGHREFRYYIDDEKYNQLKRFTVKSNDLIISCSGTVGRISVIGENDPKGIISQALLILRPDVNKISTQFLYYFLISKIGFNELINASQGAVQLNIAPRAVVEKIPVPTPSPEVQQRIVYILESLDRKIKLNRQINQTLESMAQAIFKSWFVNFDPVKAKIAALESGEDAEGVTRAAMRAISGKTDDELDKMEGEQPENYAKLKTTAELFPAVMQDSELGEVPEGWEVSNFGDVSTCFDKNRIPLSKMQREQKQGPIPYYGATSVMDFVDEHIFDDIYLLIGEDGSVLKDDGTPFIQYIWGKSWVNNHAHVLQGTNGVSTEHLMLFMQNQNITAYVTGAVQLKLNQKNMNSIPFINAGKHINDAFYVSIAPLYGFKRNAEEEIEDLSNLRDILLPKLLSGELSVDVFEHVGGN